MLVSTFCRRRRSSWDLRRTYWETTMPTFSGLFTMPTVLLNAVLSLFPDNSVGVRGPDTLAVVSPMYNEERGAAGAVRSLLNQRVAPDQVAISINGGEDRTHEAVGAVLSSHGYRRHSLPTVPGLPAALESWRLDRGGLDITVALFAGRTAKSDSINALVTSGVVHADRILVMDGDTVLDPGFIGAVRDNFYRLRRRAGRLVLEDYALQSGAVMSHAPAGSGPLQRFISWGRMAEYAFSGVLRRGQAGIFGGSRVFGRSRLFTVIGCGFVARRDLFPMPVDTMTEDHDFTLEAQGCPPQVSPSSGEQLDETGFRAVVAGRAGTVRRAVGLARRVEVRRGGNSRFVGNAQMLTEDPPHLNGFFRQVERWNGGALENALKRLLQRSRLRAMGANVHFALWSSQVEDVLGLLLLAAMPVAIALNLGNPSLGLPWYALLVWLGLDLAFTAVMTAYGFWLYRRAAGMGRFVAAWRTLADTCRTLIPFMLIKYLNPPAYVASALRVLPHRLRRGRQPQQERPVSPGSGLQLFSRRPPPGWFAGAD